MDRRGFLRGELRRAAKTAVKTAEARVTRYASRWIRPPYALDELEFLLSCSRCGECISACSHQTIFPLAARLGAQVAGTPALDLLNKACHLCTDWPCVAACEVGALKRPEIVEEDADRDESIEPAPLWPQLAVARINTRACLPYSGPECGACRGSGPIPGALQWLMERPSIIAEKCIGCALCREACVLEPKAVIIHSKYNPLSESE